jgi:hypothetical protein
VRPIRRRQPADRSGTSCAAAAAAAAAAPAPLRLDPLLLRQLPLPPPMLVRRPAATAVIERGQPHSTGRGRAISAPSHN